MKIERRCVGCGITFWVYPSRLLYSRAIWCSPSCRYKTQGWQDALYPNMRVNKKCETCQKAFTTNRANAERKKFCSKKCLGISNGKRKSSESTRVVKSCIECGKDFRVKKSCILRAKFCSRACNAVWYGRQRRIARPTSIETLLQTALNRLGLSFAVEFRIGWYSIDIAFPIVKLAIEADGSYWHGTEKQKSADARKDKRLKSEGWEIMRFNESEIHNSPDECAKSILLKLDSMKIFAP